MGNLDENVVENEVLRIYPAGITTQRTCVIETTWVWSKLNAYVENTTVTFVLSLQKKERNKIEIDVPEYGI